MIYIYLHGGLANQMFMYATGYALAKNHNDDLTFDTSYYELCYYTHISGLSKNRTKNNIRTYRLNEFNLTYPNIINFSDKIENINKPQEYNFIEHKSLIKKEFMPNLLIKRFMNIHEVYDFKMTKENVYIFGQLQDYSFFDKYHDDLKSEFTFNVSSSKLDNIKKWILKNKPIMMHVRRTDYCYFMGGWCLNTDYYNTAVKLIRNKINAPILVISDDYEYCKNNLSYENIYFARDFGIFNDYEEMYLMTLCEHFITANSTFSWWGTYLGEKENSIVCCPLVERWTDRFWPKNWNKINADIKN